MRLNYKWRQAHLHKFTCVGTGFYTCPFASLALANISDGRCSSALYDDKASNTELQIPKNMNTVSVRIPRVNLTSQMKGGIK
jgi:hypothetical protein